MNSVAIQMLLGNPAKYTAIIIALAFTSFVMTHQPATFLGILARSYGFLTDIGYVDLWVMDAKVQYVDDTKPMQDTKLHAVRGVPGVEWAVPLYKGAIRARLSDGTFQNCFLIGLDDASLIGGPANMVAGAIADLQRTDGVIVDAEGARTLLARSTPQGRVPLAVGDIIEVNDHRAVVVGIAKLSPTFQSYPVIYTTYSRVRQFVPAERKLLSFIVAQVRPGYDVSAVASAIQVSTGLSAHTWKQFQTMTQDFVIKNTGILISFGISITMSFLVGVAIAGQTFYAFTVDNLRYFGVLKALGTSTWVLVRMVLVQALLAGGTGYGLGMAVVALWAYTVVGSNVRFRLTWELPVVTAVAVLLVCFLTALLSIRRVVRLEPAAVFRG